MITPTDWIALVASATVLGGLVAVGEGLRRLGYSSATTRHLIHIGVGVFVASTPVWFSGPLPVAVLAAAFVAANAWAKRRHWFPGMHAARPQSWGTVAFPLAVFPALAATWAIAPERLGAFQGAFLVLAFADPAAAWIGRAVSSPALRSLPDRKTLAGSAAFAVVAAGAVGGTMLVAGRGAVVDVVTGALAVGLIAAAAEVVSGRGWDNFVVVQAVVVAMLAVETAGGLVVLGAVIASAAFVTGAYRTHVLDRLGAIGGGLLAVTLLVLGGWAWAAPALAFFILSSALSKLDRLPLYNHEPPLDPESNPGGRTLRQVLANGGAAWLCLIIAFLVADSHPPNGPIPLYAAFVGAFATATADTWATEVGTRSTETPVHIATLQRVPAGTSGAISLIGTAAAGVGALTIAGIAAFVSSPSSPTAAITTFTAAGIAGMLVDTLLGATVQARYRNPETGGVVERPPDPSSSPVEGWSLVDNDRVNALATTTGGLLAAGLSILWL